MSFLDTIKRGAGAVGHGIAALDRATNPGVMQKAVASTPAPAPAETPPTTAGLTLPDLDPNDPDYAEKKSIHDAFIALDKHFTDNVPGVDFQKEYADTIKAQANAPADKHAGFLKRLAIAFGSQDPNHPYAPNAGLEALGKNESEQNAQQSSDFEKALALKKEALHGHINQLMQAGEFKKALAQSAALQDLEATRGRIKSEREQAGALARIKAQNEGRANVAGINAEAAAARESRRWKHARDIGAHLNLSPSDRAEMDGLIDGAKIKFHRAITDNPDIGYLPSEQEKGQADEDYRNELNTIQVQFEDREIGERPTPAGPSAKKTKTATAPETAGTPAMVRVKRADGVTGSVPSDNLDAWLKANPGSQKL